jgi:hypothetical protein
LGCSGACPCFAPVAACSASGAVPRQNFWALNLPHETRASHSWHEFLVRPPKVLVQTPPGLQTPKSLLRTVERALQRAKVLPRAPRGYDPLLRPALILVFSPGKRNCAGPRGAGSDASWRPTIQDALFAEWRTSLAPSLGVREDRSQTLRFVPCFQHQPSRSLLLRLILILEASLQYDFGAGTMQ